MPEFITEAENYLTAPYSRIVIPDEESGTYAARVLEFPGCVAEGETVEEAYSNLERAAQDWILAAQDLGQKIPRPYENQEYSGRILLRLPRSLHQRAVATAEQEATSLNQFIVAAVAESVGAAASLAALVERARSTIFGSSRSRAFSLGLDDITASDANETDVVLTHVTESDSKTASNETVQ